MNFWNEWPDEPGLYLYQYKGKGWSGGVQKQIPLAWDGSSLWVILPEGTRMYGQKAMMYRPKRGAGLFWRIPDAPSLPAPKPPLIGPIDMGNGATFEIREYEPGPPPPMMPLIKIEAVPGLTADMVVAHYDGEVVGAIVNIGEDPPISGRWGWRRPTDAT